VIEARRSAATNLVPRVRCQWVSWRFFPRIFGLPAHPKPEVRGRSHRTEFLAQARGSWGPIEGGAAPARPAGGDVSGYGFTHQQPELFRGSVSYWQLWRFSPLCSLIGPLQVGAVRLDTTDGHMKEASLQACDPSLLFTVYCAITVSGTLLQTFSKQARTFADGF
jgi:hypothetical protein